MVGPIGISCINLYGSSLSVEAKTIAAVRNTAGAGLDRFELVRRSLPPSFEDPVTLAANAARPLVDEIGRDGFELLIVATESGVDYGKPLSSYLHKLLDLQPRCRNFEIKHACYSGTAALRMAAAFVASTEGKSRALVIMTDMARRLFGDPAEPAEGAAAVAIAVAANPAVLVLEPHSGFVSREVYDVTRPTPTLERANAMLSLGAYLDLLEVGWEQYRQVTGARSIESQFSHMAFHCPLPPLVEQAYRVLLENEQDDRPARDIADSFDARVRPSLRYCQELGNIYSGSLYAALCGLVDSPSGPVAGARVGLYSYGSGSCAELFSGLVAPEAKAEVARRKLVDHLAARRSVSFTEYEATVWEHERSLSLPDYEPDPAMIAGLYEQAYRGRQRLVLRRVKDFYREYAWS